MHPSRADGRALGAGDRPLGIIGYLGFPTADHLLPTSGYHSGHPPSEAAFLIADFMSRLLRPHSACHVQRGRPSSVNSVGSLAFQDACFF